ncbi:hypothetical protein DFO67_10465 [Modicisalibacter xianhensis]|uniref:Uncharacterized protein n=1 Tax=Modicisalibacter xianhensis TaxID=442341 RepID=A0A4R8FYS9_9GAMM|nr:hypothetical protein [Halomonas xianhensis]TDX30810.1 hypothetical protein DFO67_10465 [Halomonas xianhensis]
MVTVIDPATGEEVSVKELAERYDMPEHRVRQRHSAGHEGWALVQETRKVSPQEAMRLKQIAIQHANRIALQRFMNSAAGRLTTRLFKDYGRAA